MPCAPLFPVPSLLWWRLHYVNEGEMEQMALAVALGN